LIPYFDENVGSKIPDALKLLGLKAIPGVSKRYGQGQNDINYLERAGQKGWLAISANKRMLDVTNEKETIINKKIGIVFLTDGNMKRPDLMLLLLKKWKWLEEIDSSDTRPFAYLLFPYGRVRKIFLN
jgi:hypothetical protein